MRLLVVEDQPKIAEFVKAGLEASGFVVDLCADGETGFEKARTESYDALVLDIMLPGRDGLSILRGLRERQNPVPILLLTARTELNERVEGLNLGADDYLTKPFHIEELVARLQALTRRADGTQNPILKVGGLQLNATERTVFADGEPVELSSREFTLLQFFMRHPGRVFSRPQISSHVWNTSFDTGTNMVDVGIARLRKKIDPPNAPSRIETLRGVGYRMIER